MLALVLAGGLALAAPQPCPWDAVESVELTRRHLAVDDHVYRVRNNAEEARLIADIRSCYGDVAVHTYQDWRSALWNKRFASVVGLTLASPALIFLPMGAPAEVAWVSLIGAPFLPLGSGRVLETRRQLEATLRGGVAPL